MDDILASIREIIAEDEAAEKSGSERALYTHPTDASNANVAAPSHATQNPAPTVPLANSTQQATTANHELSATLKNIEERAARIRSDLGVNNPNPAPPAVQSPPDRPVSQFRTEQLAETRRPSQPRFSDPVPIPRRAEPPKAVAKPSAPIASAAQRATPAVAPRAATVPSEPAGTPQFKPAPAPKLTPPPAVPTPATAELEVGSTFDKIAANLLAEKSDDLEAMLGDMMRPIVRKWLGENLPTLVERLVREEIEKVSRGRK